MRRSSLRNFALAVILAAPTAIGACSGERETPPPQRIEPSGDVLAAFVNACSDAAEDMYPDSSTTPDPTDDANAETLFAFCVKNANLKAYNALTGSIDGPGKTSDPSGTILAGMETAYDLEHLGVIDVPEGGRVADFIAQRLAEQRSLLAEMSGQN